MEEKYKELLNYSNPQIVLQKETAEKKTYKNSTGWGGRGNLGFPTFIIRFFDNFIDVVRTSFFIN